MFYLVSGFREAFDAGFQVIELDLGSVVSCCSGPKRPHDRVSVADMKTDFTECLSNKIGFKVRNCP